MPTLKPRHMITETDRVSQALTRAAKIWPELERDRSALLRKIIEVGIEEIDSKLSEGKTRRLQALSKLTAELNGVWPENWREDVRSEWPE